MNGGGVSIQPQAKVIWLSEVFQWYAPDFGAALLGLGGRRPLLNFAAPCLDEVIRNPSYGQAVGGCAFRPYDRRLNVSDG